MPLLISYVNLAANLIANHIGCLGRCHHFHVNKALQLPLDRQLHTRVTCDHCDHPILGIGRTSTQTTLASIETIGTHRQSVQKERDAVLEPDPHTISVPTSLPPLRVDTAGNLGNLSTIAESGSPAARSSTARTRPNSGDQTLVHSEIHDEVPENQIQESQEETARRRKAPRTVPRSNNSTEFQSKQVGSGLRARFRRHAHKPRSVDFLLRGLHFRFEVSGTPATVSAPSIPTPDIQETALSEVTEPRHTNAAVQSPEAEIRSTPESTIRDQLSTTLVDLSEQIQPHESGHPDPVLDHTPAPHQKHERIREQRREATLKRQAEQMSTCNCQSKCHCRASSIASNAASHGRSSERSIHVPEHPLQHLLGESSNSSGSQSSSSIRSAPFLTSIGDHLGLDPATRITDGLLVDGQHDRLSQASTAYLRSNGSSISLISRRPASLMRSNTTPYPMPRLSTESIRPDIRQIIQNFNLPDPIQDSVIEPPGSSHESEGEGEHEVRERSAPSTTPRDDIPNHVNESTP